MKKRDIFVPFFKIKYLKYIMLQFNTVYQSVKSDLLSTDEDKVRAIYPLKLMYAAGVIKTRTKKRFKFDSPILDYKSVCTGLSLTPSSTHSLRFFFSTFNLIISFPSYYFQSRL